MRTKKQKAKQKRIKRVRLKIRGTSQRPRLSVYRSNRYIYAQVIDDQKGMTFFSASSKSLTKDEEKKMNKTNQAEIVGEKIGNLCLKSKIKSVVFDRGGYKFHGRVKALAEGARKAGLKF